MLDNIRARVGGGDDLGRGHELSVSAAVIGMMMRGEDVFDRLAGDALHLRDDVLVVLIEFVVNQDDAFVGHIHGDVAAVAFNLVQIVLHLIQSQLGRRLALRLGISDPAPDQEKSASGNTRDECPAHGWILYQISGPALTSRIRASRDLVDPTRFSRWY